MQKKSAKLAAVLIPQVEQKKEQSKNEADAIEERATPNAATMLPCEAGEGMVYETKKMQYWRQQ